MGAQRADLVLRTAEGWLDAEFNRSGEEPRLISVTRRPDGVYSLRIESAQGTTASTGMLRIENYLPSHLMPLFHEVLSRGKTQITR